MSDAASDLANRGEPFIALVACQVLRLIGVLDLGEVKIQELIEGSDRRD